MDFQYYYKLYGERLILDFYVWIYCNHHSNRFAKNSFPPLSSLRISLASSRYLIFRSLSQWGGGGCRLVILSASFTAQTSGSIDFILFRLNTPEHIHLLSNSIIFDSDWKLILIISESKWLY